MTDHLTAIYEADVIAAHNALDAFGVKAGTLADRINYLIASYNRNNDANDLRVGEIKGELLRAEIRIDDLKAENNSLKVKLIIKTSAKMTAIQDRMIKAGLDYLEQF
jgi:hypothetical protein